MSGTRSRTNLALATLAFVVGTLNSSSSALPDDGPTDGFFRNGKPISF